MTDASLPTLQPHSVWPHYAAVSLVCAVFPLIWIGGLVTTYKAGMAVPDWPGTYGWNLFLYPWTTWLSGPWDLMIEHGHRLAGALAGLITIGLVAAVLACDVRRWMRPVVIGMLLLLILQGCLGGARVLMDQHRLAMLHGCLAHVCFGLAVTVAVLTSRWWREEADELAGLDSEVADSESTNVEEVPSNGVNSSASGKLTRLTLFTCTLAILQVFLGAWLRHVTWYDTVGMFRFVLWLHLFTAAAITIHVVLLWKAASKGNDRCSALKRPIRGLLLLVCLQIGLGCGTWVLNYSWPAVLGRFQFAARHVNLDGSMGQALTTTAHVAVGSLVLALTVQTSVRWFRIRWCHVIRSVS